MKFKNFLKFECFFFFFLDTEQFPESPTEFQTWTLRMEPE